MEKIIKQLEEQQNIRTNLSTLRQMIKTDENREQLLRIVEQDDALWLSFLRSEDAMTRKNIALLLGELEYDAAEGALWEAYEREDTRFVKSAYLDAMCAMDVEERLPRLHVRLEELTQEELTAENRKHVQEEIRSLRNLLILYEGISCHQFVMRWEQPMEVVLTTNRLHRQVVRASHPQEVTPQLHPLGVGLTTDNLYPVMRNRMFREVLFPIHTKGLLKAEPKSAAEALWQSDLHELLLRLHTGEDVFYFRIDCRSAMTLEERSSFSKAMSAELERLSGGRLVNSPRDYEVELRLIANRDGMFFPCLRATTLEDVRFSYRKNTIAASIHPSTAALMMEMAAPYLLEQAQIMDPFCGVGTMLIERTKRVPAKQMYATDIYADAIRFGRDNAKRTGENINFIHRDFFDFRHEYLFDELVTNMPVRGKKTKEEMDRFYQRFFEKALEITAPQATIIMYTNEVGFVKKQLRLHRELSLLQEIVMQKKGDFYLLIIRIQR